MKASTDLSSAPPLTREFIAFYPTDGVYVNLAGNYDYLEHPYYDSQELEIAGKEVRPTCKEMLDAYVTPLFLEKARRNNLPVPNSYLSNGYFEPPVIIDPINPFMIKSRTVWKPVRLESIGKSMTRNFKYAICCQEIPEGAKVSYFRAVLGWTTSKTYLDEAKAIWDVYRTPLAKIRMITTADGNRLFSDLASLPFNQLNKKELTYLKERIEWVK